MRLDQLVAAYATFARGGVVDASRRSAAEGRRGRDARTTVVSPRTAFWITDILTDAEARAFIFGRGGDLEFPFPVAVKTGTSQAYHDNWTVGYTRDVTVGVWVGNFDRTPLRDSSGVTGAGPIFHAVMLAAERAAGNPSSARRDRRAARRTSQQVAICALSGMRANAWCPTRATEWLPPSEEAPAVLVAPPERRRPADDLSAGIPRLGRDELVDRAAEGHIRRRPLHDGAIAARASSQTLSRSPIRRPERSTASIRRCEPSSRRCR